MRRHPPLLSCLPLLACLCGCAGAPSAGPSADRIAAFAASSPAARYEMIDLDEAVVAQLEATAHASFAGFRAPDTIPATRIGAGDRLSVHIWEAADNGLFSGALSADRFSTGARGMSLPDQVVSREGAITIPYAGRVQAAGRTPAGLQLAIEKALAGKSVEPQVLVTLTSQASNLVTITGEVANGARVPLSPHGERLLDIVASAGGLRAPVAETWVDLQRGGRSMRLPMSRIVADARENIMMRPGDVLTLVRQPQRFMAFGATGRNAEIVFDAEGISLAQAMAKAGGLLDQRADAGGVFVFRREQDGRAAPRSIIYRLDMREPRSFFLAQRFPMRDGDLLYVSNAPVAEAQKSLQLVGAVLGPAAAGAALYSVARP